MSLAAINFNFSEGSVQTTPFQMIEIVLSLVLLLIL